MLTAEKTLDMDLLSASDLFNKDKFTYVAPLTIMRFIFGMRLLVHRG